MKTFKELLLERQLNTKEEIQKAISEWSSLPHGKKESEAKRILKAAKRIGYIVRQPDILSYVEESKEQNRKLKKIFVDNNTSKYKNQDMSWSEKRVGQVELKAGDVLLHISATPIKAFSSKETCFFPQFRENYRGKYEMKGEGYNYYYTVKKEMKVDYYESDEYRFELKDGDYLELAFIAEYVPKEGIKIIKDYR
jgi:hypothetical protein